MEDLLPALGAILSCDKGEVLLGFSIAYEVVSWAGHSLRIECVHGGIVVVIIVGQSRRLYGVSS